MIRLLKGLIFVLLFLSFSKPVQAQAGCPPVDSAKVADLANRWLGDTPIGQPRLDMIETVRLTACANGMDPNVAIAIWLHESGASNYGGICQKFGNSIPTSDYCKKAQDFGINKPEVETHYTPDGTVTEDHFMDQLLAFVGLPGYYASRCPCDSNYSFFALYRTGNSCTPSCGDVAYANDIKRIFGWLTGNPNDFPDYPNPSLAQQCTLDVDLKTCETLSSAGSSKWYHPLRPDPDDVTGGSPPLTPYCVMRPLPVEQNRLDKREPLVNLKTIGSLNQDFSKFITPLLSITDQKKSDYALPYNQKAQRYLADFLEGRAYYEPQAEPEITEDSDWSTSADIFNRVGVFRKLAPKQFQDELKIAMINRAVGTTGITNPFVGVGDGATSAYGFQPDSAQPHNYVVGYWDSSKNIVVDQNMGQAVTLADFLATGSIPPLRQDYTDQNNYQLTYDAWQQKDGGKWFKLWSYVPMFTREDSKGKIDIVDSNPPPAPIYPGTGYVEQNQSNKSSVNVTFPHLARTFEVSKTLSYLLTPENVHETATAPELKEEWVPRLWESNNMWLDPSYFRPHTNEVGVEIGPVCDVDPSKIQLIASSGDLAFDSSFSTSVNRQDLGVPNPQYDPAAAADVTDDCGTHDACEICKTKTIRKWDPFLLQYVTVIQTSLDDSPCFYYKNVSSSPDYLISHTPYLSEILTSLVGSDRAIFDLFKPAGTPPQTYEEYDWPGVGNPGEESPVYEYEADSGEHSRAEAGARKPGDSQGYFYRYLGSIQCAKERVFQVLQPFITGESYRPYAYSCFPDLEPPGVESGVCSDQVANRAKKIVDHLQPGFWGYYNRSPDYPELFDEVLYSQNPNLDEPKIDTDSTFVNMFWCTWLVVKSYDETGHKIEKPELVTHELTKYFQENNRYIDAKDVKSLSDICPGMAAFFHIPAGTSTNAHVAIVESVSKGGFTTVESNAPYKTMFYPFKNGKFQIVGAGGSTIEVSGFGTP